MDHIKFLEKIFEGYIKFWIEEEDPITFFFIHHIFQQTITPDAVLQYFYEKYQEGLFLKKQVINLKVHLLDLLAFRPNFVLKILAKASEFLSNDFILLYRKSCQAFKIMNEDICDTKKFKEVLDQYNEDVIEKDIFNLALAIFETKREPFLDDLFKDCKQTRTQLKPNFLGLLTDNELLNYMFVTNDQDSVVNICIRQKRYDLLNLISDYLTDNENIIIVKTYLNKPLPESIDREKRVQILMNEQISRLVRTRILNEELGALEYSCFIVNCFLFDQVSFKRLFFSRSDFVKKLTNDILK